MLLSSARPRARYRERTQVHLRVPARRQVHYSGLPLAWCVLSAAFFQSSPHSRPFKVGKRFAKQIEVRLPPSVRTGGGGGDRTSAPASGKSTRATPPSHAAAVAVSWVRMWGACQVVPAAGLAAVLVFGLRPRRFSWLLSQLLLVCRISIEQGKREISGHRSTGEAT